MKVEELRDYRQIPLGSTCYIHSGQGAAVAVGRVVFVDENCLRYEFSHSQGLSLEGRVGKEYLPNILTLFIGNEEPDNKMIVGKNLIGLVADPSFFFSASASKVKRI